LRGGRGKLMKKPQAHIKDLVARQSLDRKNGLETPICEWNSLDFSHTFPERRLGKNPQRVYLPLYPLIPVK